MIEVSGSPSVWNVATAHGALAAAVAAGNAASAANKAYLRMRPTPLVKIGNFFSSVLWQILPPFGKFGKDEDWERRLGISGRRADRPRRPCESASPSAPGPRVRVTALGRMQAFIVSKNPAVPERAAIATRIISTCWPPHESGQFSVEASGILVERRVPDAFIDRKLCAGDHRGGVPGVAYLGVSILRAVGHEDRQLELGHHGGRIQRAAA